MRTAILVEAAAPHSSGVQFGHRVVVGVEGARAVFEIVGEDEAEAGLGRIAPQSPLARTLIGAVVGDVVLWRKPSGVVEVEVLEIGQIDPGA